MSETGKVTRMRSGAERSDFELITDLAAGDTEALGELYLRYGSVVCRIIKRYAPGIGPSEVEDICQDVFLTAMDSAKRYKQTGTVRGWLCGIAVHTARGKQRRKWVRSKLLMQFGGQSTGMAAQVEGPSDIAAMSRMDVTKALDSLPKPQREVLLLHVLENLGGEEIGEILGISSKTVWTRLHRARLRMREALAEKKPPGGSQ